MTVMRREHVLLVNFTNFYGLPLLRAAEQRGVRVTVVGPDAAFGRHPDVAALADGRIVADLSHAHRERLLERVAAAHAADPFTGVFVTREDSVEVAAAVAAHLGLAWNRPRVVETMRNKWLTRRALAGHGFRQPRHYLCRSADEVRAVLRSTPGAAWVVKPLHGTGSRGVSRLTSHEHVDAAVAHARVKEGDEFVVEEAIEPAREYSVEGVWLGSEPRVFAVTEKETSGPPHFVETGHTLPTELEPALHHAIVDTACGGLRALGATHGLFHVEVFVDADGVVFGEAHARPGGDRITQLLELVGVDVYCAALDGMFSWLGRRETPQPSGLAPETCVPKAGRVAAVRYFTFAPGLLERVEGADELTTAHDVVFCRFDVEPGQRIEPSRDSFARHGCFVIVGSTFVDVRARADALRASVRAHLAPDAVAIA